MRKHQLQVEDIGGVTVVNFVDKRILDEETIQIIGEQLFSLVDDEKKRNIQISFANVEFLCSPAFGKLISLQKKLQAVGGCLVLCNINSTIYELLTRTRLEHFFDIQWGDKDNGPEPSSRE